MGIGFSPGCECCPTCCPPDLSPNQYEWDIDLTSIAIANATCSGCTNIKQIWTYKYSGIRCLYNPDDDLFNDRNLDKPASANAGMCKNYICQGEPTYEIEVPIWASGFEVGPSADDPLNKCTATLALKIEQLDERFRIIYLDQATYQFSDFNKLVFPWTQPVTLSLVSKQTIGAFGNLFCLFPVGVVCGPLTWPDTITATPNHI